MYILADALWSIVFIAFDISMFKKGKFLSVNIKVNESQYKRCGVTPPFSTRKNLLKKILRKYKY